MGSRHCRCWLTSWGWRGRDCGRRFPGPGEQRAWDVDHYRDRAPFPWARDLYLEVLIPPRQHRCGPSSTGRFSDHLRQFPVAEPQHLHLVLVFCCCCWTNFTRRRTGVLALPLTRTSPCSCAFRVHSRHPPRARRVPADVPRTIPARLPRITPTSMFRRLATPLCDWWLRGRWSHRLLLSRWGLLCRQDVRCWALCDRR